MVPLKHIFFEKKLFIYFLKMSFMYYLKQIQEGIIQEEASWKEENNVPLTWEQRINLCRNSKSEAKRGFKAQIKRKSTRGRSWDEQVIKTPQGLRCLFFLYEDITWRCFDAMYISLNWSAHEIWILHQIATAEQLADIHVVETSKFQHRNNEEWNKSKPLIWKRGDPLHRLL